MQEREGKKTNKKIVLPNFFNNVIPQFKIVKQYQTFLFFKYAMTFTTQPRLMIWIHSMIQIFVSLAWKTQLEKSGLHICIIPEPSPFHCQFLQVKSGWKLFVDFCRGRNCFPRRISKWKWQTELIVNYSTFISHKSKWRVPSGSLGGQGVHCA